MTTPTAAKQLETLLLRKAMTPPELAKILGVSSQAVRDWMVGAVPTIKRALAIAKFFDSPDLLRSWGYGHTADALEDGEL